MVFNVESRTDLFGCFDNLCLCHILYYTKLFTCLDNSCFCHLFNYMHAFNYVKLWVSFGDCDTTTYSKTYKLFFLKKKDKAKKKNRKKKTEKKSKNKTEKNNRKRNRKRKKYLNID